MPGEFPYTTRAPTTPSRTHNSTPTTTLHLRIHKSARVTRVHLLNTRHTRVRAPFFLQPQAVLLQAVAAAQQQQQQQQQQKLQPNHTMTTAASMPGMETITLGAGCFWCVEAIYQRVVGVLSVESGYMGGIVNNPSYGQICTGDTGHAEAVHVKFDPSKVSATELIEIFFKMHDPTTKNRQGADVGTQYRSAIFCHTEEQKRAAEEVIAAVQPKFGRPIVTEVNTAGTWYPADKGHQDYYRRNKSNNGYCKLVIHPKLSKVKHDKFKSNDGLISKLLRR